MRVEGIHQDEWDICSVPSVQVLTRTTAVMRSVRVVGTGQPNNQTTNKPKRKKKKENRKQRKGHPVQRREASARMHAPQSASP